MRTKRLGNTDLEISLIGFGSWQTGGGDWAFAIGPQDDKESIAAIRRAVELGINWIDTAPLYGLGHAEEVVAEAIRGLTAKPYVFTKCGMPQDENGRIIHSLKRESIRRECEDSLRRLRTDVIDLYQIHWNKPAEEVEEGLHTLAELREEGKIRYAGVSNFNLDEMRLARQILGPASLQPPYSLIDRDAESDVLPFCRENQIGVIVYSPMQSGLLSGRMTRERIAALPDNDLRKIKPEFREPELSRNLRIVDVLSDIAAGKGWSTAQAAVAWTLHNDAVTAAIVGSRDPSQVEGIVGAADVTLTAADIERLNSVSKLARSTPH